MLLAYEFISMHVIHTSVELDYLNRDMNTIKSRLLNLLMDLYHHTDKDHPITTEEIIAKYSSDQMPLNRKTVYADIKALQAEGYDIQTSKLGKSNAYYMASREFSLEELKLLVDAVCAAPFISHKQTKQLIQKLQNMTCDNKASELDRYLYISGDKSANNIIRNINNIIFQAIQDKRQLSFVYKSNDGKEKQIISPYAVVLDGSQYYVVGKTEKTQKEEHFQVNQMTYLQVLDQKRQKESEGFALRKYIQRHFPD